MTSHLETARRVSHLNLSLNVEGASGTIYTPDLTHAEEMRHGRYRRTRLAVDDDLRSLVAELEAEERDISRRRRLLHGKLDILHAELVMRLQRKHSAGESVISADDVQRLSRILAGLGPGSDEAAGEAKQAAEDLRER